MTKHNRVFLLSAGGVAMVALSGCVGTTTPAVATLAPINGTKTTAALATVTGKKFIYHSLGSNATTPTYLLGNGISTQVGTNNNTFTTRFIGGILGSTRQVSGSLGDNSGSTSTFIGKADALGIVTSANGNILAPDASINQAGYNYVGIADTSYTIGANSFKGVNVIGLPTDTPDMPSTGTATYAGPAVVKGLTGAGTSATHWALTNATATVTADFGAATVSTTIKGTAATGVPLNKIVVTGATIGTGSPEFFSGTVATYLGKSTVAGYSNGGKNKTSGVFYGYNKTVAGPAEVGGMILTGGTVGGVAAVYIAK